MINRGNSFKASFGWLAERLEMGSVATVSQGALRERVEGNAKADAVRGARLLVFGENQGVSPEGGSPSVFGTVIRRTP